MEKFGKYYHTPDKNIVIERLSEEEQKSADKGSFIYIESEYVKNLNDSPLKELINRGKLLLVDEYQTIEKKLFNRMHYLKDDFNNPIKYNKYQFYYKLYQANSNSDTNKLSKRDNEHDCLEFSEYLTTSIHNKLDVIKPSLSLLPYTYDAIVLQGKYLPEDDINNIFGCWDETNIEIVNSIDAKYKNYNANPEQGESYAIVSKITEFTVEQLKEALNKEEKIKHNIEERLECNDFSIVPYHIANVIYKIGDINITLEASEASRIGIRWFYPKFNMYSSFPESEYNFHNIYNKFYLELNEYKNGEDLKVPMDTIVLESRNKEKILKEIEDPREMIYDNYCVQKAIEKNKKPTSCDILNTEDDINNKRKREDNDVYVMNKKRGGNKKTKKKTPVKKNKIKTKKVKKSKKSKKK
jgi:hypothetical protein